MASSLSDILSAVQNGVIALNNMAVQIKGSFNNILSRFVTDEANIATLQANSFLMGLLSGLTLSTAGGSGTFGIATGAAANSTTTSIMNLLSAYTKTTSAWAVGTGNGSLDAGAIANSTWYHVHLIKRVDTNVVDILISLSATAPTMPTSYTLFRRIGSMLTDGAAHWTLFHQLGDDFLWDLTVLSVAVNNPGTASTLRVVTVPTGIQVWAQLGVLSQVGAGTDGRGWLVSADMPDQGAPTGTSMNFGGVDTGAVGLLDWVCPFIVRTDTSAQVRTRHQASDANTTFVINTIGWIDTRGKNG